MDLNLPMVAAERPSGLLAASLACGHTGHQQCTDAGDINVAFLVGSSDNNASGTGNNARNLFSMHSLSEPVTCVASSSC
jgi:hypothetical protein